MLFLFKNICFKWRALFIKMPQKGLLLSTNSTSVITENLNIFRERGVPVETKKMLLNELIKKEPKRLKVTVELIENLGFSINDVVEYPQILRHRPKAIEHRFKLLEEGGFKVKKLTIPTIIGFLKLCKSPVSDLKKRGLLDKNINVTRNILSYSDVPPDLYPPALEESCSFREFQESAIQCYLSWEFKLTLQEVQKALRCGRVLSPKSIRLIMETYSFLATDVQLSKQLISQNLYLILHHPAHYREFVERLPSLGAQPVREILKTNPKLLIRPIDKIFKTLDILEEFGIGPKLLTMHMDVLMLSPDTVRKRLQYLQNNPNFEPLFHHPRICKAVIKFNSFTKRFEELYETKWRTRTLDMLSIRRRVYQGRLKLGLDMSRGCDIIHYLHKELRLKQKEVRDLLKLNRFYTCVQLVSITSTLKFLREAGFDEASICSALTILLYPKEDVCRWLEQVDSQPEVDCCRDPATGQLKPHLRLQLVLYFLERPFHFTGHGVWENLSDTGPDNSPDHTSLIDPT